MRYSCLISLLFFVALSCKKADPEKALEVIDAGTSSPGPSTPPPPAFQPLAFSSRTVLAGTYSTINNLIVTNNRLYLVGDFMGLGGTSSRCIISYDGSGFYNEPNNLLAGSSIHTVCYFNNSRMLIGGAYTTGSGFNYFGYLNGGNVVSYTLPDQVYCLLPAYGRCFISGKFTTFSNTHNCAYYAHVTGNTYSFTYYGDQMFSSQPSARAMATHQGSIYMAGSFDYEKNIVYSHYIGVMGDGDWNRAGAGFNDIVYDMEEYNGVLYAAGRMTWNGDFTASMNYVNYLATGSQWTKAGTTNLPEPCNSLETHNGYLVAAGNNGNGAYLKCYNSTANTWHDCVNGAFNLNNIERIESYGGKLYCIERDVSSGYRYFVRYE